MSVILSCSSPLLSGQPPASLSCIIATAPAQYFSKHLALRFTPPPDIKLRLTSFHGLNAHSSLSRPEVSPKEVIDPFYTFQQISSVKPELWNLYFLASQEQALSPNAVHPHCPFCHRCSFLSLTCQPWTRPGGCCPNSTFLLAEGSWKIPGATLRGNNWDCETTWS